MNIAFAGFRHSHILGLYKTATEHPDINIKYCYEADGATKDALEKSTDIRFNCDSYDEILNDNDVDAVAVGDYYGIRGKLIISALKAGKHVICDKPICTDLDELDTIEALARENNLVVSCMLDLRYMPQVSKVCKLLENGEIGEIVNVSFTGQHCLDYGTRPIWYFEEGKHGGTINDIAIHGIDLIRFITKKNLTKINCAKVWNAYANQVPAFKDCGQFMVEMEEISVMADVSYAAPKFDGIMPTYWDFYFWGTCGMLQFNLKSNQIHVYKTKESIIECAPCNPEYLKDFVLEIQNGGTMMNTFDIIESQRQVLKIQKAAE